QDLRTSSLRKMLCALQFVLLLTGAASLGQTLSFSASGAKSYHQDYLALTSKAERDLGALRHCERDSFDGPDSFLSAAHPLFQTPQNAGAVSHQAVQPRSSRSFA